MRLFQQTPKGNRMNRHITLAVLSSADGRYRDENDEDIEGMPLPVIIHSSSKKANKNNLSAIEQRAGFYDADPIKTASVEEQFAAALKNIQTLILGFARPKTAVCKLNFSQKQSNTLSMVVYQKILVQIRNIHLFYLIDMLCVGIQKQLHYCLSIELYQYSSLCIHPLQCSHKIEVLCIIYTSALKMLPKHQDYLKHSGKLLAVIYFWHCFAALSFNCTRRSILLILRLIIYFFIQFH